MKRILLLSFLTLCLSAVLFGQDAKQAAGNGIRPGRLVSVEISEDIMFGRGFGNTNNSIDKGNFYFTRIDYIRGRQIGKHFSIGFLTGFNLGYGKWANPDGEFVLDENNYIIKNDFFTFSVPVMLDFKIYILKGAIAPFIGANGGLEIMYYYGSNNSPDYFSPLVGFTPKVGCNFALDPKFGISIFLGYKGIYSLNKDVRPFKERYYNGMNAGIGFRF